MAAVKRTHTAVATREGRYWLVDVAGVGVTQARSLAEAHDMARDLVVAMTGAKMRDVSISLTADLPRDLRREVDEARQAIQDLARQQQEAARRSRKAARDLVQGAGLTGRDASVILGVSAQRVSQLLAD